MPATSKARPLIAIACGGTGGHLYPGLAVADTLADRGCDIWLLISAKEVDQHAVQAITDMTVTTLPALALSKGKIRVFFKGFGHSFMVCLKAFRNRRPQAVLGMGGFTSAAPILAGKTLGAATFLHESNSIPGRANRWLAHVVDRAFVGLSTAAPRLPHQHVSTTGTPVRSQLQATEPAGCRQALGLEPDKPVLLIQGGSQGAHAVNHLVIQALPLWKNSAPDLQFLHLTGSRDFQDVKAAYAQHERKASVFPYLTEMELAMGAATAAISRAGAASLSELAAMRLPAILIPYPFAMDNHQYWNARTFADQGAALLLEETKAQPETLAAQALKLILDESAHQAMQHALVKWHAPLAATLIADKILALLPDMEDGPSTPPGRPSRFPKNPLQGANFGNLPPVHRSDLETNHSALLDKSDGSRLFSHDDAHPPDSHPACGRPLICSA